MNYSKLTLEFSMGNGAFEDNPQQEAARILKHVASRVEDGFERGGIRDLNGNTIGEWSLWES